MPTRGRRRPWPYTEESIIKAPSGRSMNRCVSLGPAGVVLRPRTILTRCALLRGSRARLSLRFRTENTVGGWYGRLLGISFYVSWPGTVAHATL